VRGELKELIGHAATHAGCMPDNEAWLRLGRRRRRSWSRSFQPRRSRA